MPWMKNYVAAQMSTCSQDRNSRWIAEMPEAQSGQSNSNWDRTVAKWIWCWWKQLLHHPPGQSFQRWLQDSQLCRWYSVAFVSKCCQHKRISYKLVLLKCRNNFLVTLYNDAASLPDFRMKWYHNEMISLKTQWHLCTELQAALSYCRTPKLPMLEQVVN